MSSRSASEIDHEGAPALLASRKHEQGNRVSVPSKDGCGECDAVFAAARARADPPEVVLLLSELPFPRSISASSSV